MIISPVSDATTLVSPSLNNLAGLPVYRRALARAGLRPRVVELFWDNFCHLEPYAVREMVAPFGARVVLHISNSRFIETSQLAFDAYLTRMRAWVDALDPAFVSDHLYQFTLDGLYCDAPLEIDYERSLDHVAARVATYQARLDRPLYLENYASTCPRGASQPAFLAALIARTGCRLLWDVTNALVAELNGRCDLRAWAPLLAAQQPLAVHVSEVGRDRLDGDFRVDPHGALDRSSLHALVALARDHAIDHIVYEGSITSEEGALATDLSEIHGALERPLRPDVRPIARALRRRYLTEHAPQPVEPHAIWQAPLVGMTDAADREEIEARMRRAGEMWLENHDLSPRSLLVLTSRDLPLSFGFQRARAAGETPKTIGPVPDRLLSEADDAIYRFWFSELNETLDG